MTYVMVMFEKDWADEFSVYGYRIMDVVEWEKLVNFMLANKDVTISFGFGTNEGWDDEPLSEFLNCYTATYISDETAKELMSLGLTEHGVFYTLTDYQSSLLESDEDDVDEVQEWHDYDKDC